MGERSAVGWKGGAPSAPSIKTVDPVGWLMSGLLAGLAVAMAALALCWRPLPLLGAPPWSLADQMGCSLSALAHMASAALFRDQVSECSAGWGRLSGAQHVGLLIRLALAGLAGCAPAALLYGSFMRPRDGLIHMRGAARFEGAEAAAALNRKFKKASKLRPDHEIAPGVSFPGDAWANHVLLAAGVGSGKSTFLKGLVHKIMEAREPIILFDPKGEFTAHFTKPIIVAPWDKRSHAWDIGKDMRNVGDMRRFAESIIEPSTDPMWSNASRLLLVGCMAHLRGTRGDGWGFQELADAVAKRQPALAKMMAESQPEAERLVEKPTVTTQGILINLAASSAPIFDLAMAWGFVPSSRRVSFVDWALGKGGHEQIILQGHASYAALTKSFARPIIETVASLISSSEMRDDHLRKRWFVCDELPALGKVNIRLLFEQGRSRGFRCVVAFQDASQLEEIHGPLMVKALTSMVGTIVVGRIGPGETAEQMSKAMGVREVERSNISSSHSGGGSNGSSSLSFVREQIPIYLPAELASRLGPNEARTGVTMSLVTGGNAYELFWPLFKMEVRRPEFVPAEWTMGVKSIAPAMFDVGADAGRPREILEEDARQIDAAEEGAAAVEARAMPIRNAGGIDLFQAPLEWLHALDEVGELMDLNEWVESQEAAEAPGVAGQPLADGGHARSEAEERAPEESAGEGMPMLDEVAVEHIAHAEGMPGVELMAQAMRIADTLADSSPAAEPASGQEVRQAAKPAQAGQAAKAGPRRKAMRRPER